MSSKTIHTVLAFYSANDGDPKSAFDAARKVGASGVLIDSADAAVGHAFKKFAGLRLDGETLVVATGGSANVEAIEKAFEGTGSPAIFILRETPTKAPQPPFKESIFERL